MSLLELESSVNAFPGCRTATVMCNLGRWQMLLPVIPILFAALLTVHTIDCLLHGLCLLLVFAFLFCHGQRRVCRAVSSRSLVPGDVVVILPGKATCDMVLLRGNCLVEESNLSGEVRHQTNVVAAPQQS